MSQFVFSVTIRPILAKQFPKKGFLKMASSGLTAHLKEKKYFGVIF